MYRKNNSMVGFGIIWGFGIHWGSGNVHLEDTFILCDLLASSGGFGRWWNHDCRFFLFSKRSVLYDEDAAWILQSSAVSPWDIKLIIKLWTLVFLSVLRERGVVIVACGTASSVVYSLFPSPSWQQGKGRTARMLQIP